MSQDNERKEPTLSELPVREKERGPVYKSLEPDPQPAMHPMAKLALLAVVLACLAFVADRGYQRYMEHRAMQELQALVDGFEQSIQNIADQDRARVEQLRRNRAASPQGRWLSKNCADWRSAYQANPLPTARTEMRRHCQTYERYLASGIGPRQTN